MMNVETASFGVHKKKGRRLRSGSRRFNKPGRVALGSQLPRGSRGDWIRTSDLLVPNEKVLARDKEILYDPRSQREHFLEYAS